MQMAQDMARDRGAPSLRAIAAALAVSICAACSSPPVRVGPKPPANPVLLGTARGSGCGMLLFGLLPIGVNERLAKAYAEAGVSAGRESATDVRVAERWWVVPLIGTVLCTDIEETAVQ
jgi:hypothetical protein